MTPLAVGGNPTHTLSNRSSVFPGFFPWKAEFRSFLKNSLVCVHVPFKLGFYRMLEIFYTGLMSPQTTPCSFAQIFSPIEKMEEMISAKNKTRDFYNQLTKSHPQQLICHRNHSVAGLKEENACTLISACFASLDLTLRQSLCTVRQRLNLSTR